MHITDPGYIAKPKPRGAGGLADWSLDRILKTMEMCASAFQQNKDSEDKLNKYNQLYVNASFELNRRNLIAPAFRPRIYTPPPISPKRESFHNDLDNYMQIIDLHWIYCTNTKFIKMDPVVRGLFESDTFDLSQAHAFSSKNWKSANKAGALGLKPHEQLGMAMFRSPQVHKLRRDLLNERDDFRDNLLRFPHGQVRRYAVDSSNIWLARTLCKYNPRDHRIHADSPVSAEIVALMYGLISGEIVAAKVMERRVKRMMKRYLEIYGEPIRAV